MSKDIHSEAMDRFFDAVLCLTSREECYDFFEDVCTMNELTALSQRLAVAGMLKDGHTYSDITATTGASTATIGRVSRTLNYGNDGYELVLKRLKESRES